MESHSAWIACCSAHEALHTGNEQWLKHFTRGICYLPSSYWPFVGEALFEERWWTADHPAAYVSKVAQTLAFKCCSDLFSQTFDPLEIDLAMHRNQELETLECTLTIEHTCKRLGISPEATRLEAVKVAEDLSYAQAGKKLGLSAKQVATYRQEIYRKTHPKKNLA